MKRVTNLLLLMLFLTSTALFSQNASPGSVKTPEQEAQKLAKMLQTKEMAPNTVISPRLTVTDANFDLQFEYPTGNSTGEAGVETDGNFIYTTLWNGTQFCKYGTDGTFIGLISVPGASAIRDLAYDGAYFYGAAANTTVFKMDFNTLTLLGTITAPTACRAIAYDEDEGGFYGNNWSTPIVLFDMTGATLATIPTAGDESYYGFAYEPILNNGPFLWGHSQKVGTSGNMLYKLNLPAGTVAESFDMLTILTLPIPGTDIAGGLYMHPDLIQGTWTLGGIVQNKCIWGIEMGLTGPPPTVDVGVTAFVSPVSGPDLGNETVKITVKNFGANAASNIPVSYTFNGGAAVNGTLAGPIASGATADFTFPGTVNCGTPGATYVFVGCTALAGDANASNNCKTVNVTNVVPTYCDASTTTEDEYIANVTMGTINNSSGWQGGVADYTAISTTIDPGASQDVVITNGTPWASDMVYIWVDWNKNFTFEGGAELTMLTNVGGTGASFTGAVACPAGTGNGDYRMRIRMTYSTAPTPCGNASYGEIEDYTIVVGTSTPTPAIQVSPMVLTQALDPDQTATQVVTVTNTGNAPLTFDLAVNTAMRAIANDTPEDYARLASRMAADGLGGLVAISHGKAGGASANQSDDATIRYDDGVNFDAIGLTGGGTFQVAAYWPAATMGQYAGQQLQKVEMYINTVPSPCKIKIYGPGSSTTPGALLYEQTVVPTTLTWNLFTLSTPVALTGQDIWIAYEVTHPAGEFPAGCDAGPAVAGYGDMISLDGVAWAPLSGYGLDYNWNLVGYIGGGQTFPNDVGVQAILSPVSGVGLGNEVVTITVKNFGTASQSNIPVSYTIDGGAAVNATVAGSLAAGATVDFTFPGTVNMSNPGQTWVFNACTALAGDQNAANNCKVASVTNIIPTYCDASTTTEDEYIANVTMGTINNSSGWQGGVADYTAIFTTIDAGASQDVVVTNGTPWASDKVTIWVDWNMNFTFDVATAEEFVLTNVGGTGASFTGAVAVPAGTLAGDYRMRIRMNYSTNPTPCGNASYGEVEDYTVKVGGTPPTAWLTAAPLTGTVEAGQSMDVNVTFNSAGLANGTYQGSLVFTTNAPATPTVTVPATLTVPTTPPVGIIFEDNFDAYTAGQQVACQNPEDWTTWSNAPCGSEDAYVSNLHANSGPNSAVIAPNNDLVKMFGVDPITAGKYSISFYAYIPAGKTGYFNTLQKFVPAGTSIWGLEVYFNAAGAGSINATGTGTASFTWTPDNWFKVEHIIDIDQDHSEIWIGGNMIYSYQWSLGATGTGQNTLHANDFFGATANDQLFFDDYVLEDIGGVQPIGPMIAVNPTSVTQNVAVGGTATSTLAISNTGDEDLTYSIEVEYPTASAQQAPIDTPEAIAQLTARMAADGISTGLVALAHGNAGGVSPNTTDDETIRYDDGVNFDAIGLTAGGTFQVAAYWPAATMAQYAGMKLNQVEFYINNVPNPCTIKIYGAGTSIAPGALLHSQTVTTTEASWGLYDLTDQVDITGEDLWIGYEVTHAAGFYPAGCDAGPAVVGYGDMITLDGVVWDPMSTFGLNYNWNLVGYLVEGITYTNDVGVQTILSPVSGPDLGNEVVTIRVKNSGTASQSNIPVSYTIDGGAAVTGMVAGPLAGGATFDYTFAGTVNMSNVGQTWVFNACTALAGDEAPANNCKTASVTNVLPVYCDASTTTEDEYIANVTMGMINNSSGWQGGVADYTAIYTEIAAGESQDVVITNGTPWASDITYIWVDWNMNYVFDGDELTMLTNVGGTGASFTGSVAVPATQGDGMYRMRIRMTYSTAPTPCGSASYGEIEDYTIKVLGNGPVLWLTVPTPAGTVAPGATVNVPLNFNAAGLAAGTYMANLSVSNNSNNAPMLDVPVTMIVGNVPQGLVVNPMMLEETHDNPPQITTKNLTVTNNGSSTVAFDVVVNAGTYAQAPVDSQEAIDQLAARMVADGIVSGNVEMAPGFAFGPVQQTDANFDLQFEYPCADASGEAGVETDGNYIYTTLWNGTQFCKYNTDGSFVGLFSVPGASAIRDLAYDGTYFYGGAAATTVFKMDFNTNTLISTITAPTACRAIAYDEDEDGFYANNWSTPIVLFDATGATLNTLPTAGDESYYGFAYQPDGMYLWGYSQKVGTSANMLYKLDLPAGTIAEEFDMLTILTMPTPGTDIAGGLYMYPDLIQGTWTLGGIVQNICLWGIEMGTTGPLPTVDVAVSGFVSPVSGPDLGNETVTITVKNIGTATQSNIPVSYTLDGGAAVTGTVAGPIASGATVDFTFPGTVNLGTPGQTYVFVGCTALAGDENPGNNCKTANVTNVVPTYCDASTTTEDEYIANVTMGMINNSSGWQGGVADYTAIYTEMEAGTTQDVVITNGTPWASDMVYIWVDWNKNFTFEGGAELTMLTNVGGTGASFTGAVACPAGTQNGEYRMRIRMTYSTAPTPCGSATYGEVEDYTINVGGTPPTAWLSADPLSGTLAPGASTVVVVTFNSTDLEDGDYSGSIVFNSNDPINPVITVPVLFHVGGECPMPAPTNLAYTVTGPTSIHLTWEAPEAPGGVIRWDDGVNFDGIGLTSGGTFAVAARWTAAQLADYVGLSLTNVDLFPRSTMTSTFTIKIWKGANASTLLHSQLVTGLTMEQWNSVALSANVVIPNDELWIGYEVGAQPAGDYPAGCDAGPAVAGFGDMIAISGGAWAALSGYGLNYNWNITGTIGVGYNGLPMAQPIVIGQSNNNITSPSFAKGNLAKALNPEWTAMTRELMGYNVYRDNAKINTTIIGVNTLVYNDLNIPAGTHEYYVTAVYPECEAKSNVVTVTTDITEIDNAIATAIYPNPATNFVNIKSGANMGRIMIMNNIGQVVYTNVADSQLIQVNTSDFNKGIYFIQIETVKGVVTEKLIIQ
jgi:hypothetical protein